VIEAALMAWFALIGVGLTLPLRSSAQLPTRLALAFPVGVGAYLLIGWVTLCLRLPFSPLVTLLVATGATLVVAASSVRRDDRVTWLEVGAVTALTVGVAAGSLVVQAVPLTRLTPDVLRFVVAAGVIGETGSFGAVRRGDVINRQLLEAVLFAPASLTARPYLPSLPALLSLAGIGATALLADEALRRERAPWVVRGVLVVVAVTFLLTTNRVVFNFFYLHGHVVFAVLLLVAVAGVWFAATTGHRPWTWLAAGALVLLVALRPEGFLVVLLVLVPALATPAIADGDRWVLAGSVAAAIVLWFGTVVRPLIPGDGLSHADGALLVAVMIIVFTVAVRVRALAPLADHSPHLLVAATIAALATVTVLDPELAAASALATWENVTGAGAWRLTWLGLPVLVGTALVAARGRLAHAAVWWTPLLGFVPLMLTFASLRGHPYRIGPGDSGNRMLMHILLVAVTFLLVAAWRRDQPSAAATEPVPSTVPAAGRAVLGGGS
jgi:hypothetical protein